ncbi:probable bacteriophage variable tail fiber protein H [Pectobacterium atrosepticum SCRI1043]|uniref:Probable bacteriophage variable tail fiber protein H n=1 Tax=Pectobacterium atrosepticum (strain SCRI 1043 / ATCC BAA-672) TaxID=218491 RepID=Q6D3Y6_PECAS|nr:phage tail protein [Pectobacterium atrosepticum]MCL6315403.1 phage tail protein [Pectobacterium atrosepticum]MCL6320361.1 phage tail protein [Pectobacterium atrosepticum]CAG75508.1 probable bacteriophage variable tail fiber protein H [Pectobacterium atrosepticum SCRI1043]
MSAKYFALLTNIGAARLANATALGVRLNISQMAVGDGGGILPTPNPAQTALISEKRRAALNMMSIDPKNPSQIIAEQVIPENEGGWWIREIGLFDDDGNLIAIANCPETYKPQLQEGSGRIQTVRLILIVSSTDAVTLKIDPAVVLATRSYVDSAVVEVKGYADNVMRLHLTAAEPHAKYAPKLSPTLTGKPIAPTPGRVSNDTQIATTAFVKTETAAIIDGSPATLDTLKKLAAAVGNNPDFHSMIGDAIDSKLSKAQNGADIPDKNQFISNLGAVSLATFQIITGKKLLSADSDALTIKPVVDGQRAYVQFNNAASTEAVAFVGLRYGANEQALTFEHRSGASIRIDNGAINFYGLPHGTTAPTGTNTTQLASTEFVQNELALTAGMPKPWPRATAPAGWLKCNGQSFDISAFPHLAAAYPSGVLPDLRGEFIRGWDDGRGVDSGRSLLSAQSDAIRNIVGEIWTSAVSQQFLGETLSSSGVFELLYEFAVGAIPDAAGNSCPSRMRFDASRAVPTAAENRPRNIAFNYIVRAA